MKTTTQTLLALAATAGFANASLVSITFDDLADGNVTNGTTITNTFGTDGVWDGGTATVSGGIVDTTSNDGYVNFASGAGIAMDLNSTNVYTFSATVDPGPTSGTMGLFGQLTAWTAGNTGYWMRLQGDNDIRWNFRRSNGTETFALWETTTLLQAPGEHTIDFVLDAGAGTASLFIDSAQVGSAFDLAANGVDGVGGILGEANSRFVVGAYNTTSSNRFDGTANSYSVTAVPEPSSTALLGLGGLALIMRRRK